MTLNLSEARRFLLKHQGLWPPSNAKGQQGILDHIQRVGCIQFDPLNIVGTNPELVLQSRIRGFKPALLQNLLYKNRDLLDGWDKMMSIYLSTDFPYFKRYRDANRERFGQKSHPIHTHLSLIRSSLRKSGPLSSIDIKIEGMVEWSWAPARIARAALEAMWAWGELVVHHRVHTRRIYDLADRQLPEPLIVAPDPNSSSEEYQDWHILRRIGGVGFLSARSSDAWLGIRGIKSKERKASLSRLAAKKRIIRLEIDGFPNPFFARVDELPLLETSAGGPLPSAKASIIAPLDNLIWDRRLIKELFSFEYVWEVYKPADQRRYGYYVLPILYGDRFVARFEPGRDRESGAIIIKNWWWEPGVKRTKAMNREIKACFGRFKSYLDAPEVAINPAVVDRENLTDIV